MKIIISDKKVKIIDKEKLRTGNVNTYLIDVEYSDVYKDRALNLYFKNGDIKKIEQVGPNNVVKIPHEVLEKTGLLFIGIFSPNCKDNTLIDRYCSNLDTLEVIEGAYDKDATYTEELTPSILEQYLQEMKDFYLESINEYNENAIAETDKFNTNADNRKKEIDAVAKEVTQNKTNIEEIEKRVSASEQNAKASETNASTSEQNAQNSANKALEIENNITAIQEDINASKAHIDDQKAKVDKSVSDVEKLVDEAINQANISKEQAELSSTNANQTSADKTAIETMKNNVSSMKSSVEQTKSDTEQIKTDTQGIYNNTVDAKNETLQAKTEVENSLENERIESDKRYAKAIESDEIAIEEYGQVELDEDGYMKDVSVESTLPEITQDKRDGYNLLNLNKQFPYTSHGITIDKKSDGEIVLNGTADANFNISFSERFEISNLVGKDLTLSVKTIGIGKLSNIGLKRYYAENVFVLNNIENDVTKNTSVENFNPEYTNPIGVAAWILAETVFENFTIYLSLVEGTEEKPYEPHGASPSLDYPSEFQNVVKNIPISNCQENLLDMSKARSGSSYGITVEANDDGTYSYVGTATGGAINVWFLGGYDNNKPIFTLKAGTYYLQDVRLFHIHTEVGVENTIVTLENDVEITGVRAPQAVKGQTYNEIKYPMIVKIENKDISYVPYKGYNENLELSEGQFLGNFKGYKNYIENDKLKGRLRILTLTGNEDWKLGETREKTQIFEYYLGRNVYTSQTILSNYFKSESGDVEKLVLGSVGSLYIALNKTTANTVKELKALLSQKYQEGNPVQVLYITVEEYEEELSIENKSTINTLKTFKGINNIAAKDCKISFKVNRDIKKVIEENTLKEREISDQKYARALKGKVVDEKSVQIYAQKSKVEDLVLKGNKITQNKREGYNILKNQMISQVTNGVDFEVNSDKSIKISGTAIERTEPSLWQRSENDILILKEGESYFNTTDIKLYIYGNNHYYIINEHSIYIPNEDIDVNKIYIRVEKDETIDKIIYPMIVKGLEEKLYEQYGASPSLDYPSEIEVTTEQDINNCKKNLFNIKDLINKMSKNFNITEETIDGVGYYHIKRINEFVYTYPLKIKEEITISLKQSSPTESAIILVKNDGGRLYLPHDTEIKEYSTTLNDGIDSIIIGLYNREVNVYISKDFQIEIGNKVTDSEPYQGKEYKIALPEGQFNGIIGDYSDKILADDKQEKAIQRLVLDGTENISMSSNGNIFRFRPDIEPIVNNTSSLKTDAIMSNAFSNQPFEYLYNSNVENGIEIYSGLIQFRDSQINSVEEWKNKLKELYEAGTPVTICYATNGTLVDLPKGTVPKIELMDDLNNVSIDSGTMSFKYNKSLVRALEERDEKIDELQAQYEEIMTLLSSTNTASLLAENLAKDNESEVI